MSTAPSTASLWLDAPRLFQFSPLICQSPSCTEDGTVVLHYGGWTFLELFWNCVTAPFMGKEQWYNPRGNPWITDYYPSGYYALRLPVPDLDSGYKSREQQRLSLLDGEDVAPNVLIASAGVAIRLQTGQDPFPPDVTICAKDTWPDGKLCGWYWNDDKLHFNAGQYNNGRCPAQNAPISGCRTIVGAAAGGKLVRCDPRATS
ncbi:MAG: hypothetical protein PHW10_04340 [Candidatus Peribacteraceae bacterium]|nr:hypothetical protein [Candidatus Peribacteraceae bacterium]